VIYHTKFHQNPPKGLGEVAKTKYLSKKMPIPGAITPSKIIKHGFPLCTSTQCDLSLYQVSSKSPKEYRRSCKDKVKGTDKNS
jgi:hypothetical protein